MFIFTTPYWKRSTPIAITRKCPINIIIEPISVTTIFDSFWVPVRMLIFTNKGILNLSGADVPRWLCVIDKCCVAAPTMGILVFVWLVLIEETGSAQFFY